MAIYPWLVAADTDDHLSTSIRSRFLRLTEPNCNGVYGGDLPLLTNRNQRLHAGVWLEKLLKFNTEC